MVTCRPAILFENGAVDSESKLLSLCIVNDQEFFFIFVESIECWLRINLRAASLKNSSYLITSLLQYNNKRMCQKFFNVYKILFLKFLSSSAARDPVDFDSKIK